MGHKFTRFVNAFLFLGGAAATVITIVYVGDWWTWLLLALVISSAAYALEAWQYVVRAYRYPQLELQVAQHEGRIDALEATVLRLEREKDQRYEAGIEEGMTRVIGSRQSHDFPPPRLIAVSQGGEELELVGKYEVGERPIPIATRYRVQVEATGESRGVVEVVKVVMEERQVHMKCVDREVERFWVGLEEWAITNATPPEGITLDRMSYRPPLALRQSST